MKNYIPKFSLLLILISLGSCGNKKETTLKTSEGQIIVLKDQHMGHELKETMVIDDQNQLERVYQNLNQGRTSKAPVPVVDFKKQSVIAAFLGNQPTGGYAVSAHYEVHTDNGVRYVFEAESPAPGTPVTMALTSPGMIIICNRPAKEVEAGWE